MDVETLTIETTRCTLQPFHMEGVDFLKLTQDFCEANKDFFVSTLLPNIEQEKEFITGAIHRRHAGDALEFFIYQKSSNAIIGSCGINSLTNTEPNIGLWITPSLHGQGFGSEVYGAIIDWTRENTIFTFLKHSCHPDNQPSIQLAKKFGGILQDEVDERGHLKFYIFLHS